MIPDKQAQLNIILATNPAEDDEHCWIRTVDDILTFEESMDSDGYEGYEEYAPDYTRTDARAALKSGVIKVYSSKKILPGIFVSASMMDAQSYSADGTVESQYVDIRDVAWIDALQGQYAPVNTVIDGYGEMSENRQVRSLQMPIRKHQMNYYRQNPVIESEDGKWIVFYKPQHFIVFNKETRCRITDALYLYFNNQNCGDDDIIAVVSQYTVNMEESEEAEKAIDILIKIIHDTL